jgi:hypothetical protein
VFKNIYAVPTPLKPDRTSSKIEDFFDDKVKDTVIDGKKFNEENNFDTDMCYGKKVFAHKVIRSNAGTIDFAGFRPLLQNIAGAIDAHKASLFASASVPKGSSEAK